VNQFRFDFDFLKDRYDYELQRKEQLTTALTLPVAVLSGLGGAIVAMARSFSYRDTVLSRSFGTVLAADGLAFFICLVYLAQAYHLWLPKMPDALRRLRLRALSARLDWRRLSSFRCSTRFGS
jgi:hypothetical protein